MILEEETFRKFGYYPSELKPHSNRKVLAACDDCGKLRITSKNDHCARCKSCSRKGEKNGNYGKHPSEETRIKLSDAHKDPSDKIRQKMSEAAKKNWQDPDYIKNVFAGWYAKPNKQEKKVGAILQKHFSKEYAYNGDFSCGITIGGKIPDFVNVNGEKIVIEVFGPWHDEQYMRDHFDRDISWKRTEFGTKAHYSQFGYKCVVFWQEDLEREDVEAFVLSELKKHGVMAKK